MIAKKSAKTDIVLSVSTMHAFQAISVITLSPTLLSWYIIARGKLARETAKPNSQYIPPTSFGCLNWAGEELGSER